MIVRFCKPCYEKGTKRGLMDLMRLMAKTGAWKCEHKKTECGKVIK